MKASKSFQILIALIAAALAFGLNWTGQRFLLEAAAPGLLSWRCSLVLAALGAWTRHRQGRPLEFLSGLGILFLTQALTYPASSIEAGDLRAWVQPLTLAIWAVLGLAAYLSMEEWTALLSRRLHEGTEWAILALFAGLLAVTVPPGNYLVFLITLGTALIAALALYGQGLEPKPLRMVAIVWIARMVFQSLSPNETLRLLPALFVYLAFVAAAPVLWERARKNAAIPLLMLAIGLLAELYAPGFPEGLWGKTLVLIAALWAGKPLWDHLFVQEGESPWGFRQGVHTWLRFLAWTLIPYAAGWLGDTGEHNAVPLAALIAVGIASYLRHRQGRRWLFPESLAVMFLLDAFGSDWPPLGLLAAGLFIIFQFEAIEGFVRQKLGTRRVDWADGVVAMGLTGIAVLFYGGWRDSASSVSPMAVSMLAAAFLGAVRHLLLGKAPRVLLAQWILLRLLKVEAPILPAPYLLIFGGAAFVLWKRAAQDRRLAVLWLMLASMTLALRDWTGNNWQRRQWLHLGALVLLWMLQNIVGPWIQELRQRRRQGRPALETVDLQEQLGRWPALGKAYRALQSVGTWGLERLAALKLALQPTHCHVCGEALVATKAFCGHCGSPVRTLDERIRLRLTPAWNFVRQRAVALWSQPRNRAALAVGVLLVLAGPYSYRRYQASVCRVLEFTPQGELFQPKAVLQVKFSDDVKATGNLDGAIAVSPAIEGRTYLADPRTLIFMPAQPLAPATHYSAQFSAKALKSSRWHMQGSASTQFSTAMMAVKNLRLFFRYDVLGHEERELVGELDLSYPVDLDVLRKAMRLQRQEKKAEESVAFTLEKGILPTRFYFHVTGLKRKDAAQSYTVTIAKGLSCTGCQTGMETEFSQAATVPERPKMLVEEAVLDHLPDETLVAVRFSLPLVADTRSYFHLERRVESGRWVSQPFKLETEYAYAILRAAFEPNTQYRVQVLPGIASSTGQTFESKLPWEYMVPIEDAHPYARFKDKGHYLPLKGGKALDIATMNLDQVKLTVEKIYRSNLVHYLQSNDGWRYGRNMEEKNIAMKGGRLNEEMLTRVDAGTWLKQPHPGLFHLSLNGRTWEERDENWMLATDLGMVAKTAGKDLWVQVLSLDSLAPAQGVKLELVDRKNVVIVSKETDARGRAFFPDWKAELEPFVVLASRGQDLSFLRLDQGGLDTSRFDTGGDPSDPSGIDGFLTSDRGLYRPGDAMNFTAILRKGDLGIARVAARFEATGADGRTLVSQDFKPDEEGLAVFKVALPLAMPTGEGQARVFLANGLTLARTSFKVEEFIPNKIRANIVAPREDLNAGGQLKYAVVAKHLFGAAAVSLTVKTVVDLVAKDFSHPAYPGFRFSDSERQLEADTLRVPAGITDHAGRYEVELGIPASLLPASMVQGRIYGEVLDSGGRPVGANASVNIHRYPYYLGLKVPSLVRPGQTVSAEWASISPQGAPYAVSGVPLVVTRKTWYTLFRRAGWGAQGFESASYDEEVLAQEMSLKGGRGHFSFKADKAGEYSVRLGKESDMRTSLTFRVEGADNADPLAAAGLPDAGRLAMSFQKEAYKPGETARLKVRAPFAGRLLLSIERDKVYQSLDRLVPAGVSFVEIPVSTDDQPNAYATGLLVRAPSEKLRDLPMVSFGVATLSLDNRKHQLDLKWAHEGVVRSEKGLNIDLATGKPGAKVVLSAVDSGILDIIHFENPDPFKHFYRKRSLATYTFSILGDVLPNLAKKLGVGGDDADEMSARHLNPVAAKRVKSFAHFSGLLTADANGHVHWKVPTDEFQGEARVMALAVKGKDFAGKGFAVKISDPLVLSPSFPRFLAPGDSFDLPFEIFNQTPAKQSVTLGLDLSGPVALTLPLKSPLDLPAMDQERQVLRAKALDNAGVATFKVKASAPGLGSFSRSTELAVRPGQPLVSAFKWGRLKPGETRSLDLPGGWIPYGRKLRLHVSNDPVVEYLGALDQLMAYPYGCAEQTASAAFPLLYLKNLGAFSSRFNLKKGQAKEADVAKYVGVAIKKLEAMQLDNGSFVMWPGTLETRSARRPNGQAEGDPGEGGEASAEEVALDGDNAQEGASAQDRANAGAQVVSDYLSDYIAHFLLEAERLGHPVSEKVLARIKKRVGAIQAAAEETGRLDRRQHHTNESPGTPYLLYLRALAGVADLQRMNAMRLGAFKEHPPQLFDRCLLSMAYTVVGDPATAAGLLPPAMPVGKAYRDRGWRWDSSTRDLAAFLLAKVMAGADATVLRPLVDELGSRMTNGQFGTTQENAWALLALSKASELLRESQPLDAKVEVGKDGGSFNLNNEKQVLDDSGLFGRTLTLHNQGKGEIRYIMLAEGTPLTGPQGSEEAGLEVSREYRDENGKELNLGGLVQGQLVVVTVRVKAKEAVEDAVIVDLLPAGFEVDNSRLSSQGRLGFEPPASMDPAYMDFRDDRVLLFPRRLEGEQAFSYSVRAVTPGSYTVPALLAEAMYDPAVHARWDPGKRLVIAPSSP